MSTDTQDHTVPPPGAPQVRASDTLPAEGSGVSGDFDLTDRDKLRRELETELGHDFEPNRRAVANLLGGLPFNTRDALENARTLDGTLLLNDAESVKYLMKVAAGGGVGAPQDMTPGERLANIKEMMRSDPKAYRANEGIQLEYRRLLREGHEPSAGPLPSGSAGVESELASLKSMMGDRKSAYWRHPHLQARYRELINAKKP